MKSSVETGESGETTDYPERLRLLVERSGLDERLHSVAYDALNWYSPDLPYHNVEHMFEVTERTIALCDEHRLIGMDRSALILAALWHDAAYPIPLEDFEVSKEHRSAELAFNTIMSLAEGAESENATYFEIVAEWTATLIISTHADHIPLNIYEEILNQADTANLSGESPRMLQNSGMLFVESQMLAGEKIVGSVEDYIAGKYQELNDWCTSAQGILTKIIENKLGATKFLEAAKSNQVLMTPVNILREIRARTVTKVE